MMTITGRKHIAWFIVLLVLSLVLSAATWQPQTRAGSSQSSAAAVVIRQLDMIDSMRGWAVGHALNEVDDRLLRSQDGGETWSDVGPVELVPDSTGGGPRLIGHFDGALSAWILTVPEAPPAAPDSLRVWHTADGGASWIAIALPEMEASSLKWDPILISGAPERPDLLVFGQFHSPQGAFCELELRYSSNTGDSWWPADAPPGRVPCGRIQMALTDGETGLITAASDSSSTPHVYWTFEVRFPWQERIVKTQQEAETLGAANRCVTSAPSFQGSRSFTVLVECSARIGNPVSAHLYQTQDDGWTWSRSTLPQPYFPNLGGYQRTFDWLWLRDEIGWAIVTDEYATETESGNLLTRLYQTENGGASWSFVKSVYWRGEFDFVDEVHGWALAYARGENALVRTTNGGRTWELLSPRLVR